MFIQIIITLLAILAVVGAFWRFHKAAVSRNEFLFWLFFWIFAAVLAWNPRATNTLANFLGVGRGADAVFYLSIALLFYLVFRFYGKLENIDHKISEMAKKAALKDLDTTNQRKYNENNEQKIS